MDEEAPLHLAAYCGHNDIVRTLIDAGFDVDAVNVYSDRSGYRITPLHWAVYRNRGERIIIIFRQYYV